MARAETNFQNRVRSMLGIPSDRIEITHGSTPGFPDTVFWPSGASVPVEFKVGRLQEGRLRADFTPVQKLWWRKAKQKGYRAFAIVGLEGKAVFVPIDKVPTLWGEGLTPWTATLLEGSPLSRAFKDQLS